MKTNTGVTGLFSVSFGTTMPAGLVYDVACEKGSVTAARGKVVVRREGTEEESKEFPNEGAGVREEVDAWAKAVVEGRPTELSQRQSPEEAHADLEVVSLRFNPGSYLSCRMANGWVAGSHVTKRSKRWCPGGIGATREERFAECMNAALGLANVRVLA